MQLEVIRDEDRLVPVDFTYGEEQVKAEVLAALHKEYKEYVGHQKLTVLPEDLATLSEEELLAKLTGEPGKRPDYFVEQNHRYDAHGQPKDGTTDIRRFTPKDFARYPLHPLAKDMLENGAYSGPGFYYRLGENLTADSVILRQHRGKLQALLIERTDGQGVAVPGGMVDPDELKELTPETALKVALKVAQRETGEESKIDLEGVKSIPLLAHSVVGDPRATVQAWPATTVFLFLPDEATASNMAPEGKDDAKKAEWQWVDVNQDLFASHKSYVWLGILEWQKQTGSVVRKDGVIGKAA